MNSTGAKVKLALCKRRQRLKGGGVGGVRVRARQENAHCDGKVSGDKEGNGLRLARVRHYTHRSSFVSPSPWSGGLATFFFFLPPFPPALYSLPHSPSYSPFSFWSDTEKKRELIVFCSR